MLMILFINFSCRWDWARKSVSPAFSITNLVATLPVIQMKITQFTDILDQHIKEGKVLNDLTSWMVKLTIDFISTTMFATDFKTLGNGGQVGESEGEVYLTHMPKAIKVNSEKLQFQPNHFSNLTLFLSLLQLGIRCLPGKRYLAKVFVLDEGK